MPKMIYATEEDRVVTPNVTLPTWNILVIDDNEDVLEITQMVLRNIRFRDRPLRLLCARSAKEAYNIIKAEKNLALALIDVVMETNTAGLDLVRTIREELQNRSMRLIVRTGQAGHAPEQDVVIAYEIDAYLQKTDISPQRLITTIIASLRAYEYIVDIQKLNTGLEHQVAQRTAQLLEANKNLYQANDELTLAAASLSQSIQIQKRFIADAAHQMKTPLAGMRMQSELAMRQTDPAEVHRSLDQLIKSAIAATHLVNQLLALARAENHTQFGPSHAQLELSDLAHTTVQDWVQMSFTRGIDLGFEPSEIPMKVLGNQVMLRELLSNLIDNALRYTPSGGSVTVRVRHDANEKLAILEVIDTGVGIAPAERHNVFERFYRILGSSVDGCGLGLPIVREIAQQHGAEVEILDNPDAVDRSNPGTLVRVIFQRQSDS